MKIEAFKAKSGKLFETDNECQIENTINDIYEFIISSNNTDFDSYNHYDIYSVYRLIVVKELSRKIVENKETFLKLFK